jgi:TNF receptor-associated protein 1
MKKPIWTLPMREMDDDKHKELFNYLCGSTNNDAPRWNLHYVTDAPMSIKGMFYIPEGRPSMHEVQKMEGMDGDATCQLRLYSRNVLIQKNSSLLPRWLRFVRGVVDCEDLPLNVSRELLQDQALVNKLKQTITGRVIKWFQDKAKRRPEEYNQFFKDYKMFMAQGVMEQDNPIQRDQLSKLLRFESSSKPAGEMTSLEDYMKNMESSQDSIAYIYSSSREAAEKSPYYGVFKSKGMEVLLCYDTYDDMLLMNLNNFNGKPIKSAEQAAASIEDKQSVSDTGDAKYQAVENLASWATNELSERAESVTISSNLTDYPAMVTGDSLGMLRYYQRQAKMSQATNDGTNQETQMLKMMMGSMKPKLLLNPKHPIVHYAAEHKDSNPDKAAAVVDHLMNWSMASAGLLDDTKEILDKTNELVMTIVGAKHADETSEEKTQEVKAEKVESEEKKTETS